MKAKPIVFLIASFVLLAASAADYPVERKTSEFDTSVLFLGPYITTKPERGDSNSVKVIVRQDKASGRKDWEIILETFYSSPFWRNYRGVSVAGGQPIPGRSIGKHVLSCRVTCNYAEALAIPLSSDVVDRALVNGIKVRWNPETIGAFETEIPAEYFGALATATR